MKHILVADDEKEIVELIELYLLKEGFAVHKAFDGAEALTKIETGVIDLAVIDVMMPAIDGFRLLRAIREKGNIPVIMLSARDDFSDKILGLDLGADDYMTKPFNPLELTARVQAQLRRFNELNTGGEKRVGERNCLKTGELLLDREACVLYKRGEAVNLTFTEFRITEYLMAQMGRVFTKQQIFEHVWGETYFGDENAVRVHMSNLRDKVENDPKRPEYIKTIRGLGYKIERMSKAHEDE
jgi:DNA-binding response OmpR family regulator